MKFLKYNIDSQSFENIYLNIIVIFDKFILYIIKNQLINHNIQKCSLEIINTMTFHFIKIINKLPFSVELVILQML